MHVTINANIFNIFDTDANFPSTKTTKETRELLHTRLDQYTSTNAPFHTNRLTETSRRFSKLQRLD